MLRTICLAVVLASTSSSLEAESIEVVVTSPQAGIPVFGEVDFSAEVDAEEEVERVELFVDDRRVATLDRPPYRTRVDVGNDNRERRFHVVAHGVTGATGTAALTTPKIHIDVEVELWLKQLYVTVTRAEEAALGLGKEDFKVFDSGLEQELVTFERGDIPMTMVLLVDVSKSMEGEHLEATRQAVRGLLARLNPLDEAMVLVFSDRVWRITDFVSGGQTDVADLGNPQSGGGTALNDYLYTALRLLDARQGRPAVILLSDGADTLSLLSMEEVLWKVKRTNAVIYRIHMTSHGGKPAFATAWRDFGANQQELAGLAQAIEESGGRVRIVRRIEDLEATLASALEELRQQYVLGYYPSSQHHDGSWNPVRVEVSAADAVVRTRAGYIDH